jgi:anti-sigma factor RsiW
MSTEQERERLSAFMDGEASPFESAAAARDLRRDPELAACWELWHLVGRSLRAEPNALDARGIAAGVREVLASGRPLDDNGTNLVGPSHQPPPGAPEPGRSARRSVFYRPIAAGLAAGLLVVSVALFVRGPLTDDTVDSPPIRPFAASDARWQQRDPEVRARLDRLLVTHQERLSGASGGIAAYAAVVGYEAGP